MKRDELSHVIRAAAAVAGDGRILIIGSQAILATYRAAELPERMTLSVEADVAFFEDPEEVKSDLVDGAIGEGSQFHQMYGYYGQGVSVRTAVLPAGWESRLVEFPRHDSQPQPAYCLDLVSCRCQDLQDRVEILEAVGGIKRRVRELIDRISPESPG